MSAYLEEASEKTLTLRCGFDDPGKLWEDWKHVFFTMRYSYEIFEDRTEEENANNVERWLEDGADPENADWRLWPIERDCMVHALMKYLSQEGRMS